MREEYKVAENRFVVDVADDCRTWRLLSDHYAPFTVAGGEDNPVFSIKVMKGGSPLTSGAMMLFDDRNAEEGSVIIRMFRDTDKYIFELQQPWTEIPGGWLCIDDDFTDATFILDEDNPEITRWKHIPTLTSGIMLAYMLATTCHDTLIGHSSCILKDGRTVMFIGKSGTGKSTHSRMWLRAIAGAVLLNDDHPVVRVADDGTVRAYGSPWSGKTDCYVNDSAPLAAIVRIVQAPCNKIVRQSPILAYASLSPSFSGMTWTKALADNRHAAIERIVCGVPCYQLECLPDTDAARLCQATVFNTNG